MMDRALPRRLILWALIGVMGLMTHEAVQTAIEPQGIQVEIIYRVVR